MSIHLGSTVQKILKERGMSVSEFARRIYTTRENVYTLFKRESIDTRQLEKIGEVLNHNFFSYFNTYNLPSQKNDEIKTDSNPYKNPEEETVLREKIQFMEKEIEYLKKINELMGNDKKSK